MGKTFIFGINALAEILAYYLISRKEQFDGFVINEQFFTDSLLARQDVFPIEEVIRKYGRKNISVYVVVAYTKMNRSRQSIYEWLRKEGIRILSFRHQNACIADNVMLGEGNIILENTCIQPFVHLGDGNILWNGVNISHHCSVGSYNYFAPSATVTGRITIGDRNFIGANSTIKNDLLIKDEVLIGANAFVNRNLESNSVFLPNRSELLDGKNSLDMFIR